MLGPEFTDTVPIGAAVVEVVLSSLARYSSATGDRALRVELGIRRDRARATPNVRGLPLQPGHPEVLRADDVSHPPDRFVVVVAPSSRSQGFRVGPTVVLEETLKWLQIIPPSLFH